MSKYDPNKWRRPDGSLPPFVPSGEPYMSRREIVDLWGLGLSSLAFLASIVFVIGAVLYLVVQAFI